MSRTHVVTGAGSGIGLALARRLAERGDRLVLLARSDARASELAGTFPDAQLLVADLADPGTLNGLGRQVDGPVDSVLHVAGVVDLAPVERLRPDVPPAVAAVVRKLMAKRPEDRFQAPADLIAALADPQGFAATAETIVALPGLRTPPLPRPSPLTNRPRRRGFAAVLLALGALLGLLAWFWYSRPPP